MMTTHEQQETDADVVIIGAGPTGLALAHMLALRGVSCILLEALPNIIDYPRGVGIDDESLRSLQGIGVVKKVLPHTTPNHVMRVVNGRGKVMIEIRPKTREFGWSRRNAFSQPHVDQVVYEELARYSNVDVRFSHTVQSLEDRGDHVVVIASDGSGGEVELSAKYVVGCDGGKSPTRKHIGVSFDGQSLPTRWIVVDVKDDPVGTPNVFLGGDPKRPYVSLAIPHGIRRFEFMLFAHEPDGLLEDVALMNTLLVKFVPHPERLNYLRKRVYTHHSRIASSFRKGRILIAGDAAHLMPVWQGQGYNSGIRDATNLGWKLAAVVKGDSSDQLLDTYTAERKDHAKAMVDLSTTFGRIVKPTNRLVAGFRDAAFATMNLSPRVKSYFSEMRYKPMPRYRAGVVVDVDTLVPGISSPTLTGKTVATRSANKNVSPVGTQFIQPRVGVNGQSDVLLDDVIGPGWAIIVWGQNPEALLSGNDLQLVEKLGARMISVRPVTQGANEPPVHKDSIVLTDVTGEFKAWFDERPTPLVVLRPDRIIAAAGVTALAPELLRAVLAAASIPVDAGIRSPVDKR